MLTCSADNIKLSKIQLHRIGQSGVFLARLLEPLQKTGLPLIVNVFKPSAKSILIPLQLTAAVAATETFFGNKIHGSGTTTLLISNKKMKGTMKIIKSLEVFSLLIKDVSETFKNKATEQTGGFLSMFWKLQVLVY